MATQAELDASALASLSRQQLRLQGQGLLDEPFSLFGANLQNTVVGSQTVCYTLCGLKAGDVVASIACSIDAVGVGTPPTAIYVGLYTAAGARVALSNDLSASSIWTASTGRVPAPLSGNYTVPTTGAYYCAFLENGAFGSTALQLNSGPNTAGLGTAFGAGVLGFAAQTSQATLPTTATFAATTRCFWLAPVSA
jgi:hypothetical protein